MVSRATLVIVPWMLACGGTESAGDGGASATQDASEASRLSAGPSTLWTGDASCMHASNCPQTPPEAGTRCDAPVTCDYTTSPDPSCGTTAVCGPTDAGVEAGLEWSVPKSIACPPLRTGGDCPVQLPPIASSPSLIDCATIGETCAVGGEVCFCDAQWVTGRQVWNCSSVLLERGCTCAHAYTCASDWFCDGNNGWQRQTPCPD